MYTDTIKNLQILTFTRNRNKSSGYTKPTVRKQC